MVVDVSAVTAQMAADAVSIALVAVGVMLTLVGGRVFKWLRAAM